jgi:NADH-quinone oxidoreductase subunit N
MDLIDMNVLDPTTWNNALWLALPLMIVLVGALSTLTVSAFARGGTHTPRIVAIISVVTLTLAFLFTWGDWLSGSNITAGMLTFNRITYVGWLIIFFATTLVILLSLSYLPSESRVRSEYYPLIMFCCFGLGLLAAAADLVTIIIGLEITALAAYVLVGILRYQLRCNEASLKYFLTGSFALAFIIMGMAFLFGAVGDTDLGAIASKARVVLSSDTKWLFLAGCAMLLIGFGFKVAAAPFHAWAPDVYDGAPTPITAFIASALKAAAFIVFIRLTLVALGQADGMWIYVCAGLAILTMVVGNLAAIVQENIKRLLAYSAIAHAGYMLIAFPSLSKSPETISAVIFYLVAYMFMTIGAFAVVIALNEGHEEHLNISSLAGLGRRRPGMAAALTLFLVSLAGFPPTVGFFAKYYLFLSTVKSGFAWLVIIAVINSAISVYFYLKPVVVMYFREEKLSEKPSGVHSVPTSSTVLAVVFLCALAVVFFGIIPTNLLDLILNSV